MIRLQPHYLPSIPYMAIVAREESVRLDAAEHFLKQSYRNRCVICGPNGLQDLVVPILGRNKRQAMEAVRISYAEDWVRIHRNSLLTAYRSAPYFEYLFPEINAIWESAPDLLIDLDVQLLEFFLKRLKLQTAVELAKQYDLEEGETDLREYVHPKKDLGSLEPYPQVFQEKHGFLSGASVLDLMMNDLPGAAEYLLRLPLP